MSRCGHHTRKSPTGIAKLRSLSDAHLGRGKCRQIAHIVVQMVQEPIDFSLATHPQYHQNFGVIYTQLGRPDGLHKTNESTLHESIGITLLNGI